MNPTPKNRTRLTMALVAMGVLIAASCLFRPLPLPEARRSFETRLTRQERDGERAPDPPVEVLQRIKYPAPSGELEAYLTPNATAAKKLPAIVWIFGGVSNGIGDTAWVKAEPENDQSASAFRKAGLVMMYPSFRGGNNNPGVREAFLGEVDDVLAAVDFLSHQSGVDPQRIYLGGHSTGATLALLAAESADRFRAVFAFGPISDVIEYGQKNLPFDSNDLNERGIRSPVYWLKAIKNPTFVFEGTRSPGNLRSLRALSDASDNPLVHFYPIESANHFSILAPITQFIANKIVHDTGPICSLSFTESELKQAYKGANK